MKKSLASCLTSVALLSSMCFSSPLAQVHAVETDPSTAAESKVSPAKTFTDIQLNVTETTVGYTHTLKAYLGQKIIIKGIGEHMEVQGGNLQEGEAGTSIFEANHEGNFILIVDGKDEEGNEVSYKLVINVTKDTKTQPVTDGDGNPIIGDDTQSTEEVEVPHEGETITVDLSNTADYRATHVKGDISSDDWDVAVSPINFLQINKTKADLKVGEGFDLNFNDTLRNAIKKNSDGKFDYKINNIVCVLAGEHSEDEDIDSSDYIIDDEQNDAWKGTISDKAKVGDKISFNASLLPFSGALAAPEESDLVQRLIDPTTLGVPGFDGINFPVEFTIVDGGNAGDEEEKDGGINFEVSPEYRKLTQKGETYKIETSFSLDENADEAMKALFEEIEKGKDELKVLFKSANPDVATVSEEGIVTAVANGSTEITAYVEGSEDTFYGVSKVDVEISDEAAKEEGSSSDSDKASGSNASSSYPKTGENFMAISAAILTLGIAVLAVAFMSKKKDTNEEK